MDLWERLWAERGDLFPLILCHVLVFCFSGRDFWCYFKSGFRNFRLLLEYISLLKCNKASYFITLENSVKIMIVCTINL